jgi:hypothetical protein
MVGGAEWGAAKRRARFAVIILRHDAPRCHIGRVGHVAHFRLTKVRRVDVRACDRVGEHRLAHTALDRLEAILAWRPSFEDGHHIFR